MNTLKPGDQVILENNMRNVPKHEGSGENMPEDILVTYPFIHMVANGERLPQYILVRPTAIAMVVDIEVHSANQITNMLKTNEQYMTELSDKTKHSASPIIMPNKSTLMF
jgi:hypothetical protein